MNINKRTLKKVIFCFAIVFLLVGCSSNLDKQGNIIAGKELNASTPWTFSAGWFDFIFIIPIAKCILFFEGYIGTVPAMVLVTIIVNLITLPLMIQSSIESNKLQMLKPMTDRIQAKYKGRTDQASRQRMAAEQQALYKKYDIKMGRTMILPFLTIPVMLAMWQVVQRLETMRTANFLGMNMQTTLSSMINKGSIKHIIILVLVAVTQLLSTKVTTFLQKRSKNYRPARPNEAQSADPMATMNITMVVMFTFMAYTMPTAMSIYWITTSLITLFRSIFIHYAYTEKHQNEFNNSSSNYLKKKKG